MVDSDLSYYKHLNLQLNDHTEDYKYLKHQYDQLYEDYGKLEEKYAFLIRRFEFSNKLIDSLIKANEEELDDCIKARDEKEEYMQKLSRVEIENRKLKEENYILEKNFEDYKIK